MDESRDLPAGAPNPEESANMLQSRMRVRPALNVLPPEQREVIELGYFSSFSHRQIAVKLGVPLGTVKTRVRLGMSKLREALA
jgi:RNA polymerase sigma-70 factor (ECF subfamily)